MIRRAFRTGQQARWFMLLCLGLFAVLFAAVLSVTGVVSGAGVYGFLSRPTVQQSTSDTTFWVARSGAGQSTFYVCRWCMPNSPTTYDFGALSPGTTDETGLAYFTTQNYGNSAINIMISGSDMTGAGVDWTLADDGNPGVDTHALKAGLNGGAYNTIVRKTSPYNDLVVGLGAASSQDWGLKLWSPTSLSDNNTKEGAVTLTAYLP